MEPYLEIWEWCVPSLTILLPAVIYTAAMGVKELVVRTNQEGLKKRTNRERLTVGDVEEITVSISGALNLQLLALSPYLLIGLTYLSLYNV